MPNVLERLAAATLSTVTAVALASSSAVAVADVRGPDVSGHQHPYGAAIRWSSAAAGGAKFAFVKATEGTGYTNRYFTRDFAAVRSEGMVRGAYHFARPTASTAGAVAQARHFVAVAGKMRGASDLPPVLDLERNDGLKPAALIRWTAAYLKEVKRLTGRTPIIYTYPAFWRTSMANTTAFAKHPLWIATWGRRPLLVGGWKTYAFWQYTDKARLSGISTPVDMNIFNGTRAQLKSFARGSGYAPKKTFVPRMTAKLSKTTTRPGSRVTLRGTTYRAVAGETVYRQGYWSGKWHNWDKTKVSSKGAYSFSIRPTKKATNTYRVYIKSTSKHTSGSSPSVKLKVS
ncbi:MAG TPA: glycoside hydrolase family 25 protein [Propionibacteriaceae bacterium]|nr:glycoside hydrolase family 25 protein [Propionibacteriaceae bacterium]